MYKKQALKVPNSLLAPLVKIVDFASVLSGILKIWSW